MRLTRTDDLRELLELLGADFDLADFEEAGEKLDELFDQRRTSVLCVGLSRRLLALMTFPRTLASVSASQTIGMVLMKEDVYRVNNVKVEVMIQIRTRVECELVPFGRSRVRVVREVEADGWVWERKAKI